MNDCYEAYGLAVRSNRPLAGLRSSAASRVDIEVVFAAGRPPEIDPGASVTTTRIGSASTRGCDDGARVLRFASHGGDRAWSMRASRDGRSLEVRWRGPIELADIAPFVETTGLSTALALLGVPMLHGCAVDLGDAAFLVLGGSGAGKSTLAAAALVEGYPLITDDLAALDATGSEVRVQPGGGQLRMHEDTARALRWDAAELRAVATRALAPKLRLTLATDDGRFCTRPRRIAAIFALDPRRSCTLRIDRLAPAAALPVLLGNTYGTRAVGAPTRAPLLPVWARLAREVPIYAVRPPNRLSATPSAVRALAAAASHGHA